MDDIRVELLTGSTSKKKRNDILLRLKAGEIDVLVGTHALYGNGKRCAERSVVHFKRAD